MKRQPRWRPIPFGFIHICCTCNAMHDVSVRLHKGVYQWKWKPIAQEKKPKMNTGIVTEAWKQPKAEPWRASAQHTRAMRSFDRQLNAKTKRDSHEHRPNRSGSST